MDALITRLLDEMESRMNRTFSEIMRDHCNDASAHPHGHDLDEARIGELIAEARQEIEDVIEEVKDELNDSTGDGETGDGEGSDEEPSPEPEPEPEKAPERTHTLHRRIG